MGASDSNKNNYTANSNVYGDAVFETSSSYYDTGSWNLDSSDYPKTSEPFFVRGGDCAYGTAAGAFSFDTSNGISANYIGFRPVLVCFQ